MHERSLVTTIIEQVCEELRIRNLGRVVEVHLQIGAFSGVDSTLVELAFAELALEHWGYCVRLGITNVPLIAECRACQKNFAVQHFHFLCPVCRGGDVCLTQGDEIRICELLVESVATPQGATK